MLSRFYNWTRRQRYEHFPKDDYDNESVELDNLLDGCDESIRANRSFFPALWLLSPLQTWLTPQIIRFKAADTIHDKDIPVLSTDTKYLRDTIQLLLDGRFGSFLLHPLIGSQLGLGLLLELVTLTCTLSSPVILRYLLNQPQLWLVALWCVTSGVATCTGRTKDQICRLHASTIAASLKSTLLAKSQRLSNQAQLQHPPTTIMNISSRDVSFVKNYVLKIHDIWSAAVQLVVIFVLLLWLLGVAAIWGYLFMVVLLVTQSKANLLAGTSVKGYSESNDQRLRLLREFLNGAKGIKLLGIENIFSEQVRQARAVQQGYMRTYLRLTFSLFTSMNQMIPGLTAAIGILAFCWSGKELSVDVIFPALALFEMTNGPVTKLSLSVTRQFSVSPCLSRISALLLADEAPLIDWNNPDSDHHTAIQIQNATFAYPASDTSDTPFSLEITSLQIPRSGLTVITGPVGSGKSTLLSSLAGILAPFASGPATEIRVDGPIFLAPQEPWIFTGTLRENIVFKSSFDLDWYNDVIDMCCLQPDIAGLSNGNETVLGAGGSNISGGQRARISLARAVYSRSSVLLLDDPLAAVDPHVARHIIEKCLFRLPQTVVLVTHVMAIVRQAALVILLSNGRLVDIGSPSQMREKIHLNSQVDALFEAELKTRSQQIQNDLESTHHNLLLEISASSDSTSSSKTGQMPEAISATTEELVQDEERAQGALDMSVIKFYAKYVGGSPFLLMASAAFALSLSTRCMVGFWFVWWMQNSWHLSLNGYLEGYLTLTILQAFSLGLLGILLVSGSLRASSKMHETIIQKLFSAVLRFFEAQPAGRIINRLSADVESVDTSMMNAVDGFFVAAGQMLASMLVILWTAPLILVIVPLTAFVAWRIQSLYRVSARELRRLSSLLSSREVVAFDEALQGTNIIRASRAEAYFLRRHSNALLKSTDTSIFTSSLDTWVTVRAEAISIGIVLCCGLLYVLGLVKSAQAGLALSTAIVLTKNVHLLLWAIVQIEIEMNSVERLKFYTEQIPCEEQQDNKVGSCWPATGEIQFENVTVQYKTRDRPALSQLSFTIPSRQKVAIVGRTGSGKSSLVAALSRLVELQSGRILVDNLDIATVDLKTLRHAVHTLPQEPFVFSGSLRQNLDPSATFSDDSLWRALDACGLRDRFEQVGATVQTMQGVGLDTMLSSGGSNCSIGELQLICMARAILKAPRVLIMDEATAALDTKSCFVIDRLMQTHFQHSTVLFVMHRVSSALGMDLVIVVDEGRVVEMGAPEKLLDRAGSLFAAMMRASTSS